MATEARIGWIVPVSIVIAMMLTIMPLPDWLEAWRPSWLLLVLVYWILSLPQRTGVFVGWTLGLLLDVLKGSLLGQHALALAVVAWIAWKLHLQIRNLPMWQQMMTVLAMTSIFEFLLFWIDGVSGHPTTPDQRIGGVITSALFWPLIYVQLRELRRRYRLA